MKGVELQAAVLDLYTVHKMCRKPEENFQWLALEC